MLPFSWKPGMQQKGNLKGTYRTLDGMDGDTQTQTWVADTKKGEKLKLEDGLLATDGWMIKTNSVIRILYEISLLSICRDPLETTKALPG